VLVTHFIASRKLFHPVRITRSSQYFGYVGAYLLRSSNTLL